MTICIGYFGYPVDRNGCAGRIHIQFVDHARIARIQQPYPENGIYDCRRDHGDHQERFEKAGNAFVFDEIGDKYGKEQIQHNRDHDRTDHENQRVRYDNLRIRIREDPAEIAEIVKGPYE
jgi:hypothetical protein